MVIMHINYPKFKDDQGKEMDVMRYISHLRMDCKLASELIKGCWVLEGIPGAGYPGSSVYNEDNFPQNYAIGMLAFDSMEDFEKFRPYVVPMRDDIPKVGNVFAYTNFYTLHEVKLPVELELWEQELLDGYVANVK